MNKTDYFNHFIYDPLSPSGLRSIKTKEVVGTLCTFKGKQKRWVVRLSGQNISCHRIVLSMHGFLGEEGDLVDHRDGNPSNNSIQNLRYVTPAINARNCKTRKDNNTGRAGVTFIVRSGTTFVQYNWTSWESGNPRQIKRLLNTKTLGLLPAIQLGMIRRQQEIEKLNNKGYGYSKRHGYES